MSEDLDLAAPPVVVSPGRLRRAWDWFYRHPARDWALLFLVIQCLATQGSTTNPLSRWAMLAAMAEDGSPRIDKYHGYTMDWAQTPDGHYFSNKAPGPALVAYPLFRAMDLAVTAGAHGRAERDVRRAEARDTVMSVLSVVTQAIPYALLTLMAITAMAELSFSAASLQLTAVALLFGNTATLFMNTFFGHGFAATVVLALFLAVYRRRPLLVGLLYGLATLSDYAAAFFIIPIAIIFGQRWSRSSRRSLKRGLGACFAFLMGGLAPGVLWVGYHTYCFGNPFFLPNKFQNPLFKDVGGALPNLWGIFRILPDPRALVGLLLSPDRGIAYTQGWVFVCVLAAGPLFWWKRLPGALQGQLAFGRDVTIFAVSGFILVILMNACFGSWHGGMTPGPRYLSVALPVFGLLLGAMFPHLGAWGRQATVVLLTMSVTLFILVYSTHQLADEGASLFPLYFSKVASDVTGKSLVHVYFMLLGFGWAGYRTWKQLQRSSRSVLSSAGNADQ